MGKAAEVQRETCHHHDVDPDGQRHGYVTRRKAQLLARLRRVEGQIRGLQRMVEEDVYCPDILTQVAAARAALDRVGLMLLEDHTRGCVARALREGGEAAHGDGAAASSANGAPQDGAGQDVIDEMVQLIQRFLK